MGFIEQIKAFILGVVEGLTEICSSIINRSYDYC